MFHDNSFAVSISDDDPDDSSRSRMRVKRKRRRTRHRTGGATCRHCVRIIFKYWPLAILILIAASALLFLRISKVGGERKNPKKLEPAKPEKKPSGNLNRLDPTTRVVHGVRERCLKILPPEEIDAVKVPPRREFASGDSFLRGTQISSNLTEKTRFNLFTGYQSMEERERSLKVNDSSSVHCGFYSEAGGFRVSKDDEEYMKTCEMVVSTCAFGGGDDLYQPIGMTTTSLKRVCYVAFWDEVTLSMQDTKPGKNKYIGIWRIVIVRELPFSDQRLNGKIPKMLGHRLFPVARYSIWVDSKSQMRRDPVGVMEAVLWREGAEVAISEHGARGSVYEEAAAVVRKHKAEPAEVEAQVAQYERDGMPRERRVRGRKGLNEASVIVREHNPVTNRFMCAWFNEVVRFTSRDQLSFPYVVWRLGEALNINVFPVCVRKDLVNSMGHLRKPKPLIV